MTLESCCRMHETRPKWQCRALAPDPVAQASCAPVCPFCRDLVFPHHENELAQSRAAAGSCSCGHDHNSDANASSSGSGSNGSRADGSQEEFVRYWLHNGE